MKAVARCGTVARMTMRDTALASLLLALAAIGCDSAPQPAVDAGMDSGPPPLDAGTDAGPREPDICDELGLPRVTFVTEGSGTGYGDLAGDFTVATTRGDWTLSEEWSGCESYVFFVHFPGRTDALFATYPDLVHAEGPRNVRYFFLSDDADPAARADLMTRIAAGIEEGFGIYELDETERAFWRARFHYVTDRATEVVGGVGDHLRDYLAWARTPESIVDLGDRGRAGAPLPVVFGIDRAQVYDPGDNLSPSVAEDPVLGMAAFLGHFYNYRATLDRRLETEEASLVTLLDERTTRRTFTVPATLPSAAEMAAFDTMEVDIEITCDSDNPFACSEWDRIAAIYLCADGEACAQRLEIARWITPYWRRGRQRYLIDATPFLGLLRDGGERSFFVELGPDWERATEWIAKVELRLRTTGAASAREAQLAYRGGGFGGGTVQVADPLPTPTGGTPYNCLCPADRAGDASCILESELTSCTTGGDGTMTCRCAGRAPFRFTPPADATRVELVTILSGHGQTSGNNCAEWCDHRHEFSVNGTALPALRHDGPAIGSERGCAARAADGVIPGQWGNWAQSRAYWCPGLPVDAERTDITSLVNLGEENELAYRGLFGGREPSGGDIALSAYVVWY
jgi:hypothetical protein